MGFDVLYFPPIHPIGEKNRKGRNNSLTPAPGDHVPQERRVAFVTRLRDGAKQAFLEAYRMSSGDSGSSELLDFFLIEKAAYELAYEAANRPAWLPIPVRGLAQLASGVLPARSTR